MARTISRWSREPSSGRSPVAERLYERRVQALQRRMSDHGIGAVLITDEDSIYYFSFEQQLVGNGGFETRLR